MAYQCPLCHQTLMQHGRTLQCASNHQFDLAKEGYVNLMPAHHKRSKDPGDNKEMMQARRKFLDSDYYAPMRHKVAELLGQYLAPKPNVSLLDIGCGEGYYTQYFSNYLSERHESTEVYGLDISKPAIRYASKRYSNTHFCVASSHKLPFADQSLDALVRIYAPCKAEEIERVIAPEGIVITVTPGANHLYELRERIYDDVRLHDETTEDIQGFSVICEEKVNYSMELQPEDGYDLLQMTPFAWKASDELRSTLKINGFCCQADFIVRVYQKSPITPTT